MGARALRNGAGLFQGKEEGLPVKVTHNPSQSFQPQIFKIKLSIWVCSIWFTDDKVKV